jgi:carbamoyltransferase
MVGNILCGVAFNYHDSSVSFALDDKIILVLEAERVFREKKKRCNSKEMEELINYGLNVLDKTVDNISYWALCTLENPWIGGEDKHPNPPVWRDINILGKKRKSLIVNHHLSHASTALFKDMDRAIILTCDGGGDYGERVTVYSSKEINLKKEDFDVSEFITAKPYDLCATYLYNAPRCEGRLMALAAFGEPTEQYSSKLEGLLPLLCTTNYEIGDRELSRAFPGLKGMASSSNVEACNFSASLQDLFVRHRIKDMARIYEQFKEPNLVLSGGACLNLEVNTKIWEEFGYEQIFIPPCCDDTGQSLGAVSFLIAELFHKFPEVGLPYVGYGKSTIEFSESTFEELVDSLLEGQLILIHNSKAEIGPRALGNRSFIARPDSLVLKEILSQKVKGREDYRPLAPIVLEEKVHEYFIGPKRSPFMLDQYKVRDDIKDRVIGTVHKDNTVRAQTVGQDDNLFLYSLLKKFGERTGTYVLINTSLNLKGEPIANQIEDTLNISKRMNIPHKIVYNGSILK